MNMLKNKKRMTFEELETIVHKIEEEERALSNLQDLHLECTIGEANIFFDTEEQRKSFLKLIEELIEEKFQNIKTLKGV